MLDGRLTRRELPIAVEKGNDRYSLTHPNQLAFQIEANQRTGRAFFFTLLFRHDAIQSLLDLYTMTYVGEKEGLFVFPFYRLEKSLLNLAEGLRQLLNCRVL